MKTPERSIDEIVEEFGRFTIMDGNEIKLYGNALKAEDWLTQTLQAERQRREEMVEAERERILSDILKWSKTATVMETTGNEGAKRATKKLRENLYGCYHFLYQAIKLTQPNNPKEYEIRHR